MAQLAGILFDGLDGFVADFDVGLGIALGYGGIFLLEQDLAELQILVTPLLFLQGELELMRQDKTKIKGNFSNLFYIYPPSLSSMR